MSKLLHSRRHLILLAFLRAGRHARRLRQSDLARLVGRSQTSISNVERGERALDFVELLDWLEALEIDPASFVHELETEFRRLGVGSDRLSEPALAWPASASATPSAAPGEGV